MITDLHLLLDQILGLDERADEFITLFTFQVPNLGLMHSVGLLQLLLSIVQLSLFVDEFLAEDTLLIIEVKEDAQVFGQLIILLGFDNPLYLSLLCDLLPDFIDRVHLIFH